jgi:putative PIN family toxin of toxin-antitoxin system
VKAVLDTNVLVSGIFFGGVPGAVLDAWTDRRFELQWTPSIFDEYLRTCARLSDSHPGLEYDSILAAIAGHGILIPDTQSERITPDPDDDKFMLCAYAAQGVVVSGDRHLLAVSGWNGVRAIKPRDFLAELDDLRPSR